MGIWFFSRLPGLVVPEPLRRYFTLTDFSTRSVVAVLIDSSLFGISGKGMLNSLIIRQPQWNAGLELAGTHLVRGKPEAFQRGYKVLLIDRPVDARVMAADVVCHVDSIPANSLLTVKATDRTELIEKHCPGSFACSTIPQPNIPEIVLSFIIYPYDSPLRLPVA